MVAMTDDDLDLIETQRLVDALYRRTGTRGGVLVSMTGLYEEKDETRDLFWRGGRVLAKGLAVEAWDALNRMGGAPADPED
jgi:hypothetical protein